jgi:hypothetical protein
MRILAGLLIIPAVFFLLFGILAFIDPKDAQLSDDSDPFGTPPSGVTLGAEILLASSSIVTGVLILKRQNQKVRKQ